jgi:hypothetical protein
VSHGNDLDGLAADYVYQAERKAWEDITASAIPIAGPSVRVLGNSIDRVL